MDVPRWRSPLQAGRKAVGRSPGRALGPVSGEQKQAASRHGWADPRDRMRGSASAYDELLEFAASSLRWSEPPTGTQGLALIFDDVDAPAGTWVHWVMFNIPATTLSLAEGVPPDPTVAGLGVQGANSWRNPGYGGPCPPKGGPHRYTFRLYALDTMLDLDAGASRAELDEAMEGHILGTGQLMGQYSR